ncbi:MAG: hypothetical protein R3208_19820 [Ketobacteraceae bacterium]|nr:hypothetical protein [Ketobacteraceae bacterium]
MPPATLPMRPIMLLFVIAAILMSPALLAGFMGDDLMHLALFKKGLPISPPDDASLFGLFSFMNADPSRNRELMNLGLLPWWTYPEMKYAFWRPLSELTHGLDAALWPGNAVLMHAHSIAWYLILCSLVFRLYRHFHPQLPNRFLLAGFALYLLDASHGFTLSWIANRNGLIAATFGLASIYAYVKAHDENNLLLNVWSLVFLALALLAAELGVSTIGYLGAYALFIDKRNLIRSCLSVLPHILVVALWWVTYRQLGFGAANADAYYLDPVASPLAFLATLGQRLIVLFGSQWGLVPAEIYGFSGSNVELANTVLVISLAVVITTMLALFATLKQNRVARFWLCGALFSSLPVCAALPHDRLLLFLGVGAMGVFLALMDSNPSKQSTQKLTDGLTGASSGLKRIFLVVFFVVHLVVSPLLLPVMAYSPKIWASQLDMTPAELRGVTNPASKQLVLFNVPMGSSMALTTWRFNAGLPVPDAIWPVNHVVSPIRIEGIDPHRLRLRKEGGFVQNEEESVRAIASQPFHKGDQVELGDLRIRILAVENNRPTEIELTFTKALNDESLLFLSWDEETQSYRQLEPPAPGQVLELTPGSP